MKSLFVVLLALAPLAAGCGSDPASFQGSEDALKDASTSRVEWKMEGKHLPDWASLTATGSVDYANGRGELVINGKNGSTPIRGLYIGHDSYLGVKLDGTWYWLKESVDATSTTDRFVPGPGGMSPDRLLKELIKSSTKVEKLGGETIRGVATIHYRGQLEKGKYETEPPVVDVWVDQQGLPRRIRATRGSPGAADAVDLFAFGVRVDVEAPPANEIVSDDKFNKLMEKECAGVEKHPEDMNFLCASFLVSPGDSKDSVQIEPTETAPTTEGK